MKIYISTSDRYTALIEPFAFLFNKFWSSDQQVVILGYTKPDCKLPENFEFISMGISRNDPKEWSTDLRKYFQSIDDEWFIYGTEDMFLVYPVDFNSLNKLKTYMKPGVGRINITNDVCRKDCSILEDNVVELTQTADYRISCIYSIWNREYMLKYLQPEMTPWEFEIDGSIATNNDGYQILGLNSDFPVQLSLAVRRGNFSNLDFRFDNEYHRTLDQSVLNEMTEKGILEYE
tara:strand:+ start:37 stop:735 length:699 start_codon:yes stop_codon:yes gene_type:complete